MRRLPEQRLGSQWPRSQHAALNEGRCAACSPSPLSCVGVFLERGGLEYFFELCEERKLSFLWRTIVSSFREYVLAELDVVVESLEVFRE